MPMLKVADSCLKVGPAHGFGCLLFLHQSPSYETFCCGTSLPSPRKQCKRVGTASHRMLGSAFLIWALLPVSLMHPRLTTSQSIPPPLSHKTSLGPWCSQTVLLILALSSLKLCCVIQFKVTGFPLGKRGSHSSSTEQVIVDGPGQRERYTQPVYTKVEFSLFHLERWLSLLNVAI